MAMRDSELCETVFQTDFGMSRLSPSFVREADSSWPDGRCTKRPKWVSMVGDAFQTMHYYDYAGIRKAPKILRRLSQLKPYMDLHA